MPEHCISKLFCAVCQRYEDKICGMKHFSRAWITGLSNQKTSNIVDHTKSDQHKAAMARFKVDQARSQNKPITSYSKFARCLSTLDKQNKVKLRRKFEICYRMAKESILFTKYPALHQLENYHGIELGNIYCIADSAKIFTSNIVKS